MRLTFPVAAFVVSVVSVGACLASADAKPPHRSAKHHAEQPSPEEVAASFQAFCAHWMELVWARDWHSLIKWKTDGDGVEGTYAGYGQQYTCTVNRSDPPVGKVSYLEVQYRKHGKTIPEAEDSQPQPTESTDIDEYFTYINGKWQ